jgi:fucose 4-O-acetylase-like acetyltransferase
MREGLWDRARGIGILLVVYGHVLRGLVQAGLVPHDSPLVVSDFVIYTFHMPLFFLLAGMNAARGINRDNFLKSKISTIVYPYFLWSLIQGVVQMGVGGTNSHITPLLLLEIIWQPQFQFWFLSAIFVCHVLARLNHADPLRLGLLALAVYPLGTFLIASFSFLANPFSMLIFYAAGMFLDTHLKNIVVRLSNPLCVLATLIGLVLAADAAYRMGSFRAPSALSAAFLGMLLVLQMSQMMPKGKLHRAVELLGLASMPIYLVHVFGTASIRIILLKLGVHDVSMHMLAGVVVGIAVPMVVFYAAYRLRREGVLGFSSGEPVFGRREAPQKKLVAGA